MSPRAWPRHSEHERLRTASNAGSIVTSILLVLQVTVLGLCVFVMYVSPEATPEWIETFVDEIKSDLSADRAAIYETAFHRDCVPWLYGRIGQDTPFMPLQTVLPKNFSMVDLPNHTRPGLKMDPDDLAGSAASMQREGESMVQEIQEEVGQKISSYIKIPGKEYHNPTIFQAKWCAIEIIDGEYDVNKFEDTFAAKAIVILVLVAIGAALMLAIALSSCLCAPTNCCRYIKTMFVSLGDVAMGFAMHLALPYCETIHIVVFAAGIVLLLFAAVLVSQCSNKSY